MEELDFIELTSIMLGVLMPIEELASLMSDVLTWTLCLRLQGNLLESKW